MQYIDMDIFQTLHQKYPASYSFFFFFLSSSCKSCCCVFKINKVTPASMCFGSEMALLFWYAAPCTRFCLFTPYQSLQRRQCCSFMGTLSLGLFHLKWTRNVCRDVTTVFEDVKSLLRRRGMNWSLYFRGSGELRGLKDS